MVREVLLVGRLNGLPRVVLAPSAIFYADDLDIITKSTEQAKQKHTAHTFLKNGTYLSTQPSMESIQTRDPVSPLRRSLRESRLDFSTRKNI
jgi:hypothetical protein